MIKERIFSTMLYIGLAFKHIHRKGAQRYETIVEDKEGLANIPIIIENRAINAGRNRKYIVWYITLLGKLQTHKTNLKSF